jgi:hypothetical protein
MASSQSDKDWPLRVPLGPTTERIEDGDSSGLEIRYVARYHGEPVLQRRCRDHEIGTIIAESSAQRTPTPHRWQVEWHHPFAVEDQYSVEPECKCVPKAWANRLELGGWWPYILALADALATAIVIALLAITMVISVQTFDRLAEHSGGADARVLALDKLFDGIEKHPSAPEYWRVYALLLSTMIPSLLNLIIGGASLLRGIPGLPTLLLRFMPSGKVVPAFDRIWLALVLTCQVFLGAFLGIAAQFVLAIGVIFYCCLG